MPKNSEQLSIAYTVRHFNTKIGTHFDPKASRTLRVTGFSGTANFVVGLGKLLLGIYSMSFFTCVSAFYTFGMVIAKYFALSGILRAKSIKEQYRYYFLSGIILVTASLFYIAYSIRLFTHPTTAVYHMYVALAIAAFTFTELTLNIRGVIAERHNHTPLFHAIKMINLASSLICLVLTQIALLSFADPDFSIPPVANAIISVAAGVGATIIGITMIIRIRLIKNEKNYCGVLRKIKHLMKKESMRYTIKPVRYVANVSGDAVLYVHLPAEMSEEENKRLSKKVRETLQIDMLVVTD